MSRSNPTFFLLSFLYIFLSINSSFSSDTKKTNREDLAKFLEKVDEVAKDHKKLAPLERSNFYYENHVESSATCYHCPEYLKLITAVNQIVDKVKVEGSVEDLNRKIVEVDRLKFLYYETLSSFQDDPNCPTLDGAKTPKFIDKIDESRLQLLAEEMLDQDKIRSLQIYPNGMKEARYFYRGTGIQSHLIIEVIVKNNNTATVRYHHYNEYSLPDLIVKRANSESMIYGEEIITGDLLHLRSHLDINYSKQGIESKVNFDNKELLIIEATNHVGNDMTASVKLPFKINVPIIEDMTVEGDIGQTHKKNSSSSENMKSRSANLLVGTKTNPDIVSASIAKSGDSQAMSVLTRYSKKMTDEANIVGEYEKIREKDGSDSTGLDTVRLSIVDESQDHEYVKATLAKSDYEKKLEISANHKMSLSESDKKLSVGAKHTAIHTIESKEGINEILLSLTDLDTEYVTLRFVDKKDSYRDVTLGSSFKTEKMGKFSGEIDISKSGGESLKIDHSIEIGNKSLNTTLGRSKSSKKFVSLSLQQKIDETTSMIVEVALDENRNKKFLYQYKSKF